VLYLIASICRIVFAAFKSGAGGSVKMDIIRKIEELRTELQKLGSEKGFQDVQVIKVSQILDELITRYYRMIQYKINEMTG